MTPNKMVSCCMVLSLVLIGMVLGEFLDMFGISDVPKPIQEALDESKFLPKEILIVLIVTAIVLSVYLIILMMQGMELKEKGSHNSNKVKID